MSNQRALLLTLRIKRDSKAIGNAVRENFGYCPQVKWFDYLVDQRNSDQKELKSINEVNNNED